MKTISSGLKTLLTTSETVFRYELLTITLAQGAGVFYYNNSDVDLVYNGHTYLAGDLEVNPGFKRGPVTTSIGTDTKTAEVTLLCGPATKIGTVLVPTFAQFGGFDNAIIEIDCLPVPPFILPNAPDTSRGIYNIWTGIVGDVKYDRTEVQLEVSSMMRILQGAFPRNYALPTCNNTLYDTACTLNKSTFSFNGTVAAGSWTTNSFNSNATAANDYYDLGWIQWTSGQNNNLQRTVKTYLNSGGNFLLTVPLPFVPQAGDTFTAFAGCDKTQATCTNKFSNLGNFRAYPFVPNPMTLLAGAGTTPVLGSGGGGIGAENINGVGGGGGTSTTFKQN